MSLIIPMPPKLPDEVLDYSVDFADRLLTGEAITGVPAVVVTRGSVTPSAISTQGAIVTFWLSGGVALESCLVKVEITTNSAPARTHEVLVSVPVASPGP